MRTCVGFLLVFAAACGGGDETSPDAPGPDAGVADASPDAYVDLSGQLFDPGHIVEVSISMADADWDALRVQTRTIGSVIEGDCLAAPAESPFTLFPAQITVDGTSFASVGIKKKGFFGSLNLEKPSLKVKFEEYVSSQEYLGLEKLTLNNANQDPAFIRQCLAYQTFAAAGLVVPRCNFAHVIVNGADLGIYVNVESVDHKLTRRRYLDGSGPLYEGALSDFRSEWVNTFDPKGQGDLTDLMPLVTVLETATDGELAAAVAALIDLPEFYTYWAMEVITAHWDGYTNDKNNFFVYSDPSSDRIRFIPWGVDATFQPGATFGAGLGAPGGVNAVAAAGLLPNRLFAVAETRAAFLARERELLATVWDENALLAEIDRMEALIAGQVESGAAEFAAAVDDVRDFVIARRGVLTDELDAGPVWTTPMSDYPCLDVIASVEGTFATTFGTLGAADPVSTGSGTLTMTIAGVTEVLTPIGVTSGLDTQQDPPAAAVQVFGLRPSDGHVIVVFISMPWWSFVPRAADVGFFDAFGAVFDYDPVTDTAIVVGYLLGSMVLDQASTSNGAAVSGSFRGNADAQAQ